MPHERVPLVFHFLMSLIVMGHVIFYLNYADDRQTNQKEIGTIMM